MVVRLRLLLDWLHVYLRLHRIMSSRRSRSRSPPQRRRSSRSSPSPRRKSSGGSPPHRRRSGHDRERERERKESERDWTHRSPRAGRDRERERREEGRREEARKDEARREETRRKDGRREESRREESRREESRREEGRREDGRREEGRREEARRVESRREEGRREEGRRVESRREEGRREEGRREEGRREESRREEGRREESKREEGRRSGRYEKREEPSRVRDDKQHRPHSPRTKPSEREKTQVFMETEEEGQENRRTDRFRNERFDNPESTTEFGKDRYFSPRTGRRDRSWRGDRGSGRMGARGEWGEGPRERDFNRYRGADRGDRGRTDNSSQRLFESLTDPTEVPRLGNFFEHDDRETPQRRRPSYSRVSRTSDSTWPPQDSRESIGRSRSFGRSRSGDERYEREWDREKDRDRGRRDRSWRDTSWGEQGLGQRDRGRERRRSPDMWKHDMFEQLETEEEEEGGEEGGEKKSQQWRSVVQKVEERLVHNQPLQGEEEIMNIG